MAAGAFSFHSVFPLTSWQTDCLIVHPEYDNHTDKKHKNNIIISMYHLTVTKELALSQTTTTPNMETVFLKHV